MMTPFVLLQITSLMCFLYSLKIKMYKTNFVGFITILTMLITVLVHLTDLKLFENIHYCLMSSLLIFIAIYNTYKKYHRHKSC